MGLLPFFFFHVPAGAGGAVCIGAAGDGGGFGFFVSCILYLDVRGRGPETEKLRAISVIKGYRRPLFAFIMPRSMR